MALWDNIVSGLAKMTGRGQQPSAPVPQPVVTGNVAQPSAPNVLGMFGNLGLTSGIPDIGQGSGILPNIAIPDFQLLFEEAAKQKVQQAQTQTGVGSNATFVPSIDIPQVPTANPTQPLPGGATAIQTIEDSILKKPISNGKVDTQDETTISVPTNQSSYYEKYSENKTDSNGMPISEPYNFDDLKRVWQSPTPLTSQIKETIDMAGFNAKDTIKKAIGDFGTFGIEAGTKGQQAVQGVASSNTLQDIQNYAAGSTPVSFFGLTSFEMPGVARGGAYPGATSVENGDFIGDLDALLSDSRIYNFGEYKKDVQSIEDMYRKGYIDDGGRNQRLQDLQESFRQTANGMLGKYAGEQQPTIAQIEDLMNYASNDLGKIKAQEEKNKGTNIGFQLIASNINTPEQTNRFYENIKKDTLKNAESLKVIDTRVSTMLYANPELMKLTEGDTQYRTNLLEHQKRATKDLVYDPSTQLRDILKFYDTNKASGRGDSFSTSFTQAFDSQYTPRVIDYLSYYDIANARLRDQKGLNKTDLATQASAEADKMFREKYKLPATADVQTEILKPLNDVIGAQGYTFGETIGTSNTIQNTINDARYIMNSYVDWGNIIAQDPFAGTLQAASDIAGRASNTIRQPLQREVEEALSRKGLASGLPGGQLITQKMDPSIVDTTLGKLGNYANMIIDRPDDGTWDTFTTNLYAGTLDNLPAVTQAAVELYGAPKILEIGQKVMRATEGFALANDFNKTAKVMDFLRAPVKGVLNTGILGEVENPAAYAKFQQIAAPVRGFLWENVENAIIAGNFANAGVPYTDEDAKIDLTVSTFASLFAGLSKVKKTWNGSEDLMKEALKDDNVKQVLQDWGIKYPSVKDVQDVQNVAALGPVVLARGKGDEILKNAVAMQQMMQAVKGENKTYAYFLGQNISDNLRSGKYMDLSDNVRNFSNRQATIANLPDYDPAKFADSYIARTPDNQAVINVGKFSNGKADGRLFLENLDDGVNVSLQDRIAPELESLGVQSGRAYTPADIQQYLEDAKTKNIKADDLFEQIPGTEMYRAKNLSESVDGVLIKEATTTVDMLKREKALPATTKTEISTAYDNQYDAMRTIHQDNPQAVEAVNQLQQSKALENMTMSLEPTLKDIYC